MLAELRETLAQKELLYDYKVKELMYIWVG